MPIHSIWRCLNTLYSSKMDAGGNQWWLTASTMTPQHIWAPPYPNFPKFGPHPHMYNSVRVHPYTHPQHIKFVKHLLYIRHWCEMNIGWVYSRNHRISPWLIGWELPGFLSKFEKLGRHERPYRGGDTSICTSTAYKGCPTPFIYIIWMWDEYGLGLQLQSPHFTITYQLRLAQFCGKESTPFHDVYIFETVFAKTNQFCRALNYIKFKV